ncbi:virion structural protein [Pseudomonas phage PA1C]|uniref:Uncharacterized protein n=1 Tax=Pseudomonas phage vB_PaeM_PS119XW TaxID=2601632 RepID=A0A5C1K8C0_9CAUD|nr:hypothetical protein PP933_gp320 [Pseudomonas phage vB_PaeM_PS119XW]QBX32477.1 virion structural protein [Pseudomonas phage PA1C]QEM42049.1 hypothetical protein [Pseudomonas phage vB_PaeM_PS119XW]BEG72564.1 hypothetical protein RVBP21_1920 [Pseudomonas phage BRkr]
MAIYSLDEAGKAMSDAEIAQYEDAINEYLSLPGTVDFLNDPEQAVHFVHRHFRNVTIAETSVAALKKAIEDAGWKSVSVEIKNGNEMFVSFYVEEQPEAPVEPEPGEGGDNEGENGGTGGTPPETGGETEPDVGE